jgi:rhodanese-related sulfurtransferase
LVDVREREENALGSIPSAVNLPLSELRDALAENFNAGEFQNVSHNSLFLVPSVYLYIAGSTVLLEPGLNGTELTPAIRFL